MQATIKPAPIRTKHNKIVVQNSVFVIFSYRLWPTSIGPERIIGLAIASAVKPQTTIQNKIINIFLSFLFIYIKKVIVRLFSAK